MSSLDGASRRQMFWGELNVKLAGESESIESMNKISLIKWGDIPVVDTGSRFSGANLTSYVMKHFPKSIQLNSGRTVRLESLTQYDINAGKLTGGVRHIAFQLQSELNKLWKEHVWSRGHFAVMPPFELFGGFIDMKLGEELVEGQAVVLPPICSVAILSSTTVQSEHQSSSLAVMWFHTEFGVEQRVVNWIKLINWEGKAYSWSY